MKPMCQEDWIQIPSMSLKMDLLTFIGYLMDQEKLKLDMIHK